MVIFACLFLSLANALVLETPTVVDVDRSAEFYIEITNTSNYEKNLTVNFFSSAVSQTFAPNKVPANTTVLAKIIIFNKYDSYTELESKVEVKLNEEHQERKILFRFHEQSKGADFGSEFINNANSFFTFFGAGAVNSLFSLGDYSVVEVSAITILVLLILVLFVALVVRIVKRV